MAFTQQEIEAEDKRRYGAKPPRFSREEIEAEDKRRASFGAKAKKVFNNWVPETPSVFEDSPGQKADRYWSHATAPVADALRGGGELLANAGISAANLLPGVNIDHVDTTDWRTNSPIAPYAEMAGKMYAGGRGFAKAQGGAMSMAPKFSGAGMAPIAGNIGVGTGIGGGIGYATGESKENPGYLNSGRLWDTALGAAGGLFGGTIGEYNKLAPKNIAPEVAIGAPAKLEASYTKDYKKAFELTKDAGISKAKINKINAEDFFAGASKSEQSYVKEAFKTQKLEDIHKASKDLGRYISEKDAILKASKQGRNSGLSEVQKDALDQARKIKSNMDDALHGAFDRATPEAKEAFKRANETFKRHLEYKQDPTITAYNEKSPTGKRYVTDKQFVKDAAKSPDFQAIHGAAHPEIMQRHVLGNILKGTAGILGGGAALKYGSPIASHFLGNG